MKQLFAKRLETPALGPGIVLALTLTFVALTLVRGGDWFLNDTPGTLADVLLDLDFGLKNLGLILVVSALIFFAAIASQLHTAVWAAHALLAAAYFGCSLTITGGIYEYGAGASHLAAPLGGFVWHSVLLALMGVVPRSDRNEAVRRARHSD